VEVEDEVCKARDAGDANRGGVGMHAETRMTMHKRMARRRPRCRYHFVGIGRYGLDGRSITGRARAHMPLPSHATASRDYTSVISLSAKNAPIPPFPLPGGVVSSFSVAGCGTAGADVERRTGWACMHTPRRGHVEFAGCAMRWRR
jgi:hypothetical protein